MAALLLAHPACDPFVLDRKQGRTPAEDPPAEDTSDDAIRAAVVAAQEAVPLRGVPTGAMTPQTSHFTLVTSSLVRRSRQARAEAGAHTLTPQTSHLLAHGDGRRNP